MTFGEGFRVGEKYLHLRTNCHSSHCRRVGFYQTECYNAYAESLTG